MRKSLASRLFGLAIIYCVVFCLIVLLQFSNVGNFSLSAGAMSIRGRYLQSNTNELLPTINDNFELEGQQVTGGVRVFYGGLEFSLREERGKGLMLTREDGNIIPVNPDYMVIEENAAHFFLPGGTLLTFHSFDSARGFELQITAQFAQDISDVTIPIIPRRSSLVRDSGQLGIMFSGSRYVFSTLGPELENGYLSLSKDNAFISYRSRGNRQIAFDPVHYRIDREQNYDNVLRSWLDTSFVQWNQNPSALQNEDDIVAYLSQTLMRGNYQTATQSIPGDFLNSSRQSHRSSAYIGGMTGAYRSFLAFENEKLNSITRLVRQRSLDVLMEEHVLDFLFSRSNTVLANDIINIINNAQGDMMILDYCLGLLEYFNDVSRWRPELNNSIDHLTESMLALISESLVRDTENDAVFASNSEGVSLEYSVKLGMALTFWAEVNQITEWAAIGRSLVLSSITDTAIGGNAGKLHNIINPTEFHPKALLITNDGHWAWTVSQSIRAATADGNINLSVTFPVNMTHHVIIRGVQPFLGIQIHNMAWRTDSQFERYDSSGWVYYPEEQILILKLRHRANVENVRIIYRAAPPPPPPAAVETGEAES
ncbi:MAG: hypothetical protein FWD47_01110 [Treponema sp.]|nr:hypothetical protein [Treponema sp.]